MPEALKDVAFTLMGWLLTPLGMGLLVAARVVWRRAIAWRPRWRRLGRALAVSMVVLAGPALILGGYGLWIRYRPQPSSLERTLHPGIEYRRFARTEPRPVVVHVATIDLDTPGLELVPTPVAATGPGGCMPALTTSRFVARAHVQLAINTQFFYSCPGAAAPEEIEEGQPVRPVGVYAVAGELMVDRPWHDSTVYIAADGVVTLYGRPARIHHAISGRHRLVEAGRATAADDGLLAPRVALGFDATRRHVTMVVVDGRQRGYSEGLTLPELAALLVELGVRDAIELDGGGSATLVVEDEDGAPLVLNSPIHTRIPGRERPVANHLGVRVTSPAGT